MWLSHSSQNTFSSQVSLSIVPAKKLGSPRPFYFRQSNRVQSYLKMSINNENIGHARLTLVGPCRGFPPEDIPLPLGKAFRPSSVCMVVLRAPRFRDPGASLRVTRTLGTIAAQPPAATKKPFLRERLYTLSYTNLSGAVKTSTFLLSRLM